MAPKSLVMAKIHHLIETVLIGLTKMIYTLESIQALSNIIN
jgi:hypothetical protein